MAILQVEKIINSGIAPSFTTTTEATTDLGTVQELNSKTFTVPLPKNVFDTISIESPYSHISITRTGFLTINNASFTGTYNTEYFFYVVYVKGLEKLRVKYKYKYTKIQGDIVYKTPGSYTFIVPAGVASISALGIAAGGGGSPTWANSAGGGGCLAYINSISVTPGQLINITVPGTTNRSSNGGSAVIGTYLSVQGGTYSQGSYLTPNNGGTLAPTGAGQGGHVSSQYGGGGGAGGYGSASGTDARGGYSTYGKGYPGSNGAGGAGGGYSSSTYSFGGGGGVYPYGRGSSGSYIPENTYGNSFLNYYSYGGRPGSDGEFGAGNTNGTETSSKNRTIYHGEGGQYGGGGSGGGTSATDTNLFSRGAQGVVRIAYGTDLAYPTTNTAKQSITQEV
jgi:hypothetical protein